MNAFLSILIWKELQQKVMAGGTSDCSVTSHHTTHQSFRRSNATILSELEMGTFKFIIVQNRFPSLLTFPFCLGAVAMVDHIFGHLKAPKKKKMPKWEKGGNNNPPAVHFLHNLTKMIKIKPAAEHKTTKGRVSDMDDLQSSADPSRSCWQVHWPVDIQLFSSSWLLKGWNRSPRAHAEMSHLFILA